MLGLGNTILTLYRTCPDFCAWSVRHGAILGLSRVNKICLHLPMKDGLSEVAWAKLVEREAAERDTRVLQAFNLAQVS